MTDVPTAGRHRTSTQDDEFRQAFEACDIAPAAFDHAAHVRLAYVYLCGGTVEQAVGDMRRALLRFLEHHGIPPAKYHETLTRAWIMAVDHFMQRSPDDFGSVAAFTEACPELLDSRIMLTHYSAEVLFSAAARQSFVEPDVQSIPPPR